MVSLIARQDCQIVSRLALGAVIYLAAEEAHGSGVLAVVVSALILGQRSVWKAIQLVLESLAFLMFGFQFPTVVGELAGISPSVIAIS